ncbi:MAG: KamA family radical SAM protein [Myxococcales bacterium]|nr:KamA family radical SAM protein [Myxococcales bacterium]
MNRFYSNPELSNTPWAHVAPELWVDWGWQIKNRITDISALAQTFELTKDESDGLEKTKNLFRFSVCPYYALLADKRDTNCPIRKQIIPSTQETILGEQDQSDPLGEEMLEVAPNLIHRYPDRVLLLATDRCPVYCRFCTRRRIVGRLEQQATRSLLQQALDYIKRTKEIREVLISGGDALMNGDQQLKYLMQEIRSAAHIDVIRVATRMPATCPMRITPALVEILRDYGPTYIMTHFNHEKECTEAAARSIKLLLDAGIQVMNQSVLLQGINDSVEAIENLNRKLVFMRAIPYYLHQCDLAEGISHFRTPLQTGIDIIDGLRGRVSGLMIPKLCVDVPGGLGKVTVQPDWMTERSNGIAKFRTFRGSGQYPDIRPADPIHADMTKH